MLFKFKYLRVIFFISSLDFSPLPMTDSHEVRARQPKKAAIVAPLNGGPLHRPTFYA